MRKRRYASVSSIYCIYISHMPSGVFNRVLFKKKKKKKLYGYHLLRKDSRKGREVSAARR